MNQPRVQPVAAVAGIPSYVPGRIAAGLDAVKLSSNENPYPPLPCVLQAVQRAGRECNRYPDMACTQLVQAIAEHHQADPAQVVVGTGSSAVLYAAMQAFAGPGDEVVYPWRSFEAYPIAAQVAGASPVPVALGPGWEHDLPALVAAITPCTRVVMLCTPNNPTGTALSAQQVREVLRQVPEHVLVVLDQAYVQFITQADAQLGEPSVWLQQWPNLLVLRTFSKAYGLAGLRVGYALAHPHVAAALRSASVPFGVSGVAQAAALACLHEGQLQLQARVEQVVAAREQLQGGLVQVFGEQVVAPSHANFIWLHLQGRSQAFAEHCLQQSVAVRVFPADAIWPQEGVRVSVGTVEENARLLRIAQDFAHL